MITSAPRTVASNGQSSNSFVHQPHRCPYWIAWLLASPLRRLAENPAELADKLAGAGDRVLEIGPGLGFYTLPLARAVGATGRVLAVDSQQVMLDELDRRARRARLNERIELRIGGNPLQTCGLRESIDVAVLVNVVHEAEEPQQLLAAVVETLRPGAKVFLREPAGHCSQELIEKEIQWCAEAGLELVSRRRTEALFRRAETATSCG